MIVARTVLLASILSVHTSAVFAADAIAQPPAHPRLENRSVGQARLSVYRGRVTVMDGRTLWFSEQATKIRLLDIDTCELPQWAFDPKWDDRDHRKAPPPVPCGPLAKAWLKRTTGDYRVECSVAAYDFDGVPLARCTARGSDLAREMLRVGWARVDTPYPDNPSYLALQRHAMAARYGMWATYVLDMGEWRRKAIDRTLSRRPVADFNLLVDRESEISPPFADARKKPKRTGR